MEHDVTHRLMLNGSEHLKLNYKCNKICINNFSADAIRVKVKEDWEYIKIPSEKGEEFTINEKGSQAITELWIEGNGEVEVQETAWAFNNQ